MKASELIARLDSKAKMDDITIINNYESAYEVITKALTASVKSPSVIFAKIMRIQKYIDNQVSLLLSAIENS